MPPMVAANSSGRSVGDTRTSSPEGRIRSSHRTWSPKLPARSWFLPWISLATAPPTVAKAVPGEVGGRKPRPENAFSRSSKVTPASQTSVPSEGSNETMRFSRSVSSTLPPPFSGASP